MLLALLRTLWRLSYQEVHDWLVAWPALALACGFLLGPDGRVRMPSEAQQSKRLRAAGAPSSEMLFVLLVLSIIKSALIIAYFMHLKFERAIMRWMLVLSVTACFIIMYFFFFPDAGRILRLGVQ